MTPAEYAIAAKQTESVVDSVSLNSSLFNLFATISIASGEVLDLLKKNAFYGKPINQSALAEQVNVIRSVVNQLPETMDKITKNGIQTDLTPNVDTRIVHCLLGVVTESAELLTVLQNYINTGDLDRVNLGEELGDVDWYQAIGIDALGLTQEQVWDSNITKLHKKRYKTGTFTATEAINRDVTSERAQLEADLTVTDHPETTPVEVSAESAVEVVPEVVEAPVEVAVEAVAEPTPTQPVEVKKPRRNK